MKIKNVEITEKIILGGDRLVLIAGPCVIENHDTPMYIAEKMREVSSRLGIDYVFKASYDKANRTSHTSFRSIGFEESLKILDKIRTNLDTPVLTDVHETIQTQMVADVADILQIPAFLCRQTDLIQSAAQTSRPVNIKRGQFMAPEDMAFAVEKATAAGNNKVFLTERGTSFGYHNLVVDMRALPIMRQFTPVVFDVTHSVQQPGGLHGKSGGNREYTPFLARAAAAVGVDGFFIETHPKPDEALSDGPNMIPLDQMQVFLEGLLAVWQASRPFVQRL